MHTWLDYRVLAFALLLTLSACGGQPEKADTPSTLVATAIAKVASVTPMLTAYGRVEPDPATQVVLTAPRDVQVSSVAVHLGDVVRDKDEIATLVTAPLVTQQYAQAQSALKAARQDAERIRRLYQDHLASRDQLAAAEKAETDAAATVAAQRAIGADEATEILRAPIDGVITSLPVSPGDRISPAATIANIAKSDGLIVIAGAEPDDASKIEPGSAAKLASSLNPTDGISAKVETVARIVDPTTRLVNVMLRPNLTAHPTPGKLPHWFNSGASVTASINLPKRKGIEVPITALLEDANGNYVFVDDEGKARRRDIKIALETKATLIVASGLKAGERVVISGNAALEDGMTVREAAK